jgi:hypothetical protein
LGLEAHLHPGENAGGAASTVMDYGKGWGDPTKYCVAHGWEFVGPDRERKQYFYMRCKECGAEQSFVKY